MAYVLQMPLARDVPALLATHSVSVAIQAARIPRIASVNWRGSCGPRLGTISECSATVGAAGFVRHERQRRALRLRLGFHRRRDEFKAFGNGFGCRSLRLSCGPPAQDERSNCDAH